ncbi:hypothetical protein RVBP17_2650 [Pseudomonas phage sp. 30-3]|uniref:Uncharacterized protein n=1 Tax=Pseudomonas phage vB_PaeM_PA5oct TaxID=2163605 RepID=A0A4Y5JU70_9CAUD|nr:hypothetical protein PQE65_gp127 [Pseudomonas phage vB_PaeM_PA5oct]QCG76238.1 hypothetical protein EST35_0358 [Pseudomonas phage vB_PaeM_PA5oct]WPK40393.1 hypothetical protein Paride_0163 [Pseudomonas phage Paride]BDR25691.1 hypothetical protein RVBP16_1310 [Pseudomonas phage sp. 30-2]BDR26222.1 hypothetical protein RVBP17_2650 [Pseudomonas phage sp. 30-3]
MAGLRKCIDEFCKGCIYDPESTGSWRQQVENCSAKSCELWEVRPVSVGTKQERIIAKQKSSQELA